MINKLLRLRNVYYFYACVVRENEALFLFPSDRGSDMTHTLTDQSGSVLEAERSMYGGILFYHLILFEAICVMFPLNTTHQQDNTFFFLFMSCKTKPSHSNTNP